MQAGQAKLVKAFEEIDGKAEFIPTPGTDPAAGAVERWRSQMVLCSKKRA